MRVVSLLASGTEIVCGLGAGGALVGRSHECDNPEWVRALPACTRPAFDVSGASREIDAEVKRRLRAGEPLYHVDADLINTLEPDLLIAQVHCHVCAVTPDDVERSGCSVLANRMVSLSAGSLTEIYGGIRTVAAALGRDQAGDALVTDMQARIGAVTERLRGRPRPTVVTLEWTDPVFTSGNWGPELIEAAGGAPLLGEPGLHSMTVGWEQIVEANPDYLVVAPCGFSLDRTIQEIPVLERLPGWFQLTAVKDGRVALADGNKYFNRSGTTVVETVQILAEILHCEQCDPGWRGRAWCDYHDISRHTGAIPVRA